MKKNSPVVGIFAHPDDESFGPSGTIAKYAQKRDVYVICVTDGDARGNNLHNLDLIREKELKKSAKILGVKKVFFLRYRDGELNNNLYHQVAGRIKRILDKLKPEILLTFEMRGLSGHIDHVFCSMVTSYLFFQSPYVNSLMYYTAPKFVSDAMKDYFIYFPPGCDREEVDKIEDITYFSELKKEAIKCHQSQIGDVKLVLKLFGKIPKEEYFFIVQKKG